MATQQQPQMMTFPALQQQGMARPPAPKMPTPGQAPGGYQPAPGGSPYNPPNAPTPTPGGGAPPSWGGVPWQAGGAGNPGGYNGPPAPPQRPNVDPGHAPPAQHPPAQPGPQTPGNPSQPVQPQGGPAYQGPNLEAMWSDLAKGGNANFHPGGYQGPGQLDAYRGSNFQAPQVQQRGQFTPSQGGAQVDQRTQQSVMEALGRPSRYGAPEVGAAFDVLNHRLTQQGNSDKQMIDEDMASRGIYASTTAGGRLGDLATNLNQQRADFSTNLATDQARNYQSDRASAISQAMGYGGQQFSQGLAGFGANQGAGQQRFLQEQAAGEFGLNQNNQNYTQQADQYGRNQQEGLNKFNSGLDQAQFGLNQNNQNFNQRYSGTQGLQGFGQASFDNQLRTSQFNSDQDYRNNQMILQSLGYL